MSVIRWEEPDPRPRKNRSPYYDIAEELRARPGEWALIREGMSRGAARGLAVRMTKGDKGVRGGGPFWPPGSFEAVAYGADNNAPYKVYGRYLGETFGPRPEPTP